MVQDLKNKVRFGTAYFSNRDPHWVQQDMRTIRDAGFTHVLHTWSEADLSYYAETMAEIIALSRAEGLEVYVNPWGVGRIFGGEAFSEYIAHHPDACQRTRQGAPLPAACPNHPGFQDFLLQWLDTVCHTEVETLFWDEPHFFFSKKDPLLVGCYCQHCQKQFADLFHTKIEKASPEQYQTFRETSLIHLLTRLCHQTHTYHKRNCICVLPPWFDAGISNWEAIAQIPDLDELSSDPYWETSQRDPQLIQRMYQETAEKIMKLSQQYNLDAQIWIKNYQILAGTEDLVRIASQTAWQTGVHNLFSWSFKGSEAMSWLRSDHPDKVWHIQSQTFRDLAKEGSQEPAKRHSIL